MNCKTAGLHRHGTVAKYLTQTILHLCNQGHTISEFLTSAKFKWELALGNGTAPRPHFYQTRSAWFMDQGSTRNHSAVHNFVPTVTKFCVIVMWEGLSLPHDTKFGNCRDEIVDWRVSFIWALIHGPSRSGLIKVGPGVLVVTDVQMVVVVTYFLVRRSRHCSPDYRYT